VAVTAVDLVIETPVTLLPPADLIPSLALVADCETNCTVLPVTDDPMAVLRRASAEELYDREVKDAVSVGTTPQAPVTSRSQRLAGIFKY
jgi:hypothetical protein